MEIYFGALSPKIQKQLDSQGIYLNHKDTELIQKFVDANNLLRIHGIIMPSEAHKGNVRIMKKIEKLIKEKQELYKKNQQKIES